jgi:hypothetical protein
MSPRHEVRHTFERTPGAATRPLPHGYRPRNPQTSAFYGVIADHVETMLQEARDRSTHGFGLPRYVERSFERFLACGVLSRGFARVRCGDCSYEILVPFSCKTRSLCPSCEGRRMSDLAAHLVDRVLPEGVGYRQWTLSFPRWLRFRLLCDPALVSAVLSAFVRTVFAYQRRRARALGVANSHAAAVTAVQRFGSFAPTPTSISTR